MKKRDLIVILAVLLSAVALLFYGYSMRNAPAGQAEQTEGQTEPDPATEAAEGQDVESDVSGTSAQARQAASAFLEEYPAESYLLLTTANGIYSPIPLNEENSFKVKQKDGSENTVHIGKNSFYMESSNCDNQNCVGEGEVTLENRDSRILYNMVICLPHQISLELLTPAETQERLLELYAGQEAYLAAQQEVPDANEQSEENHENR